MSKFGWRVKTEQLQAGDRVRAGVSEVAFTIVEIGEVVNGFRRATITFDRDLWHDGSPTSASLPVVLGYVVDTRQEYEAISTRRP